jgi:hypothetical protein
MANDAAMELGPLAIEAIGPLISECPLKDIRINS